MNSCWCSWEEADPVTHEEFIETNNLPRHEPFSEWEDALNKYGDDSRYELVFRGVVDPPRGGPCA